jgi:hypothetical protein
MVFLILPPCEKNSWLAYSNKSCFASLILISLTYHLRYRRAVELQQTIVYENPTYENSSIEKGNLEGSLQEVTEITLPEINKEINKHDAFYTMLPKIENFLKTELKTEHTDKELSEIFNVPVKLMRSWLERAVKLGRVKKLAKPVRYVIEPQLCLLNNAQYFR